VTRFSISRNQFLAMLRTRSWKMKISPTKIVLFSQGDNNIGPRLGPMFCHTDYTKL
jgi:hypothetical protein